MHFRPFVPPLSLLLLFIPKKGGKEPDFELKVFFIRRRNGGGRLIKIPSRPVFMALSPKGLKKVFDVILKRNCC